MRYYLTRQSVLKRLESPSVYQVARDELFELDGDSFRFLEQCSSAEGCDCRDSAFTDYCLEEGLLTTERIAASRPPRGKAPSPSLRYLELQITDSCNLKCRHCYLVAGGRHLPPRQVHALLAEFEGMQGLRVLLTGGEPLVHPAFDEINEMLPDFGLRRVLFTNGVQLRNGTLKRLKVHELQVSIDGMERGHDALRGAGTHNRALTAVQQALDAGFEVSVSTMVHPANLAEFEEMEALFRSLGVREWTVDVPCGAGRLAENRDAVIAPEDGGKYLAYGYGGGMHGSGAGYGCGLHLMAVLPDGSAAKCTFYGDRPVGSAVDEGLAACWARVRPVKLEALDCDCEFLEVCRGGCRYRAALVGGDRSRDPYRCSLYGILNDRNDQPERS